MKRIITIIIAAVMALSLVGCASDVENGTEDGNVIKVEDVVLENAEDDMAEAATGGDETITVRTDANGAFRSAVISRTGDDMEEDADIGNIPFAVNISYFLDGERVEPGQIEGASGKLKIRFDYKNESSRTVNVNGEDMQTIVPFAFISMVMLPQDRFSNVEVTNGGVSSMGEDIVAYGFALPGLEDELNIAAVKDELKAIGDKLDDEDDQAEEEQEDDDTMFPDFVEITADTANCKIEFNVTMVTNGLLRDTDDGDLDEFEDAVKSLWDFGGIGGDLADGVQELYDGVLEFGDGLDSYIDGAGSLADGASQLSDGANALASQSQALNDGAAQLAEGLAALQNQVDQMAGAVPGMDELSGYIAQISAGASQLSEGVNAYTGAVSQIAEGASALSTGAGQLSSAGYELSNGYSQLEDGVWELLDGVYEIRDRVFWNISSLSVGNVPGAINKLRALKQADLEYTSLAGEGSGEGSVRFILEADEIG